MTIRINVNGKPGTAEDCLLSPLDQGFLFGASVYETIRTYDGVPFLFHRHLERLRASAATLAIELELDDEALQDRVHRTLDAAGNPESSIRIVVSTGVGAMDYRSGSASVPTIVIIVRPLPQLPDAVYRDGAAAAIVAGYAPHASATPRIKSSSLLANVMALRAAQKVNAYEAILVDDTGGVCEGSMSNVFVVNDGSVRTPPLSTGILQGITREIVIDIANEHGVALSEESFSKETLIASDEVFITASSRQVVPITTIDNEPVATGQVGPLTKRFMNWYNETVRALMRKTPPQP